MHNTHSASTPPDRPPCVLTGVHGHAPTPSFTPCSLSIVWIRERPLTGHSSQHALGWKGCLPAGFGGGTWRAPWRQKAGVCSPQDSQLGGVPSCGMPQGLRFLHPCLSSLPSLPSPPPTSPLTSLSPAAATGPGNANAARRNCCLLAPGELLPGLASLGPVHAGFASGTPPASNCLWASDSESLHPHAGPA